MRKSVLISVPEPCYVSWDSMTKINEQERHCTSCDRMIVDFSKMSDAELVNYFNKKDKLCGRFASHQIGRNLQEEQSNPETFSWKTVFLFSSLALIIPGFSQNNPKPIPPQREIAIVKKLGNLSEVKLEGFVKDSVTNAPLKRVLITLRTDQDTIYQWTDTSGYYLFVLKNPSSDTAELEVDEPEYQIKTEKINLDSQVIRIDFQMNSRAIYPSQFNYQNVTMGGAVSQVVYGKRSPIRYFFYRLFHPRRFRP